MAIKIAGTTVIDDSRNIINAKYVGQGGTVAATGSITLTASSSAQQRLSPTGYGQIVTLPDATTLIEGVTVFNLTNSGNYPMLIKNNSATILRFIRPKESVMCSLADNATSAGSWDFTGGDLYGVDAMSGELSNADLDSSSMKIDTVALDANRDFIVITSSLGIVGLVYDTSTNTFGSATTISSTNATYLTPSLLKVATDKVMILYGSTGTLSFGVVVVTFSGTTITAGTPVTTGTVNSYGLEYLGEIVDVNGVYVFTYSTTSNRSQSIHACTISGTTPTIGTGYQITSPSSNQYPCALYAVSTTVVLAIYSYDFGCYATPFTISGTTMPAIGTGVTLDGDDGYTFISRQLSSGRFAVIGGSSNTKGIIVSVSGTTATKTSVSLFSGACGDFSALAVSNQVIVFATANSGNTTRVNVLTDSSGTAVAGTEIVLSMASGNTSRLIGLSTTALYVYRAQNSGSGPSEVYKLTLSGNDPVATLIWRGSFPIASDFSVFFPTWNLRPDSSQISGNITLFPNKDSKTNRMLLGTNICVPSVFPYLPMMLCLQGDYVSIIDSIELGYNTSSEVRDSISQDVIWIISGVRTSGGTLITAKRMRAL